MINLIKNTWKKLLITLGIASVVVGVLVIDLPIPNHELLKTDKANIVSSRLLPGNIVQYSYKDKLIEEDFKLDPAFSNFDGVEVKRFSNGRTIKTGQRRIDGKLYNVYVQGIFSGLPQYHEENGKWFQIEYATTTKESYNRQTLSSLRYLVAYAASFFSTAGDGYLISNEAANQTWASKHDPASAGQAFSADAQQVIWLRSGSDADKWNWLRRGIFPFDTSTSTLAVTSSTIVITSDRNPTDQMAQSMHITSSTNKGATLVLADYNYLNLGTTSFAEVDVTNFGGDGAKHQFLLNASGRAHLDGQIGRSTSTTFSLRFTMDYTNTPAHPGSQQDAIVGLYFSEQAGTGSDPILYIEFAEVVSVVTIPLPIIINYP